MLTSGLHIKLRPTVLGVLLTAASLLLTLTAPAVPVARADTAPPGTASPDTDWRLCEETALEMGHALSFPFALLAALTVAEAGRPAAEGRMRAWPWTINVEGRGYFFTSKNEAVWAVRRLLAEGVRSIDIGCMQVNLRFHPRAFTSLEEAFEPRSNIAYGAHFLKRLQLNSASWDTAIANYHSYSPHLNSRYAARVKKIWRQERLRLTTAGRDRIAAPALPIRRPANLAFAPAQATSPPILLASETVSGRSMDIGTSRDADITALRQSTAAEDLAVFDRPHLRP